MPHATNEYPFEWRVLGAVSTRLTPLLELTHEGASSLVRLDDGSSQRFAVQIGLEPEELFQQLDQLRANGRPHLAIDPLDDGREYRYLSWAAVPQALMEAWLGEPFTAADFVSKKTGASRDYPESWGVMF